MNNTRIFYSHIWGEHSKIFKLIYYVNVFGKGEIKETKKEG